MFMLPRSPWCPGHLYISKTEQINPQGAKVNNLNVPLLKVVFRYRDPQFQVSENICLI